MPYCLKCGSQVEDTNTFCPNCGTRLKDAAATSVPTASPSPQVQAVENNQNNTTKDSQVAKKLQKPDHGFVKYLAAGLVLITVAVSAILKMEDPKMGTGGLLAIMLVLIGLIIIVAGVYVAFAGRKHVSSELSDATSEKPKDSPDSQKNSTA